MNDLRNRFHNLDKLRAPDLWHDAQARAAAAAVHVPRRASWVLVIAALVLALLVGGAALIGSGLVKLPAFVDQSATPRPTVDPSPVPGWTAGSSMPSLLGSPSTFTGDTTATLLSDGRVLVVGGPRSELFDPATGEWTATGPVVQPRRQHVATLLADGSVLVVGGGADLDGETASASAELYDPTTQTWSATGSMLTARSAPTATLLADGRVLVAGGSSQGGSVVAITSAELYDPASGTWSAAGDMTVARVGHTATLLTDGRVLVAGGTSADGWFGLASAELFDPASGTWTATPDMVTPRADHTATLLPNGQVLIVGMGSGELYDPAGNVWIKTGPMHSPNFADYPYDQPNNAYHTATLMPDGRVLVAGGGSEICCVPETTVVAQIFDPASRAWTRTESMLESRGGQIAILLSDGRVLLVAGWSRDPLQHGSKSVVRTVEFYTPDRS